MNRFISLGCDHKVRQVLISKLGSLEGVDALDVATGTGDLAILLAKEGARVRGEDLSEQMLALAREKNDLSHLDIHFHLGDASRPIGEWDVITIGWGLRNIPDVGGTIKRHSEALKQGGVWGCLDLAQPENIVLRFLLRIWLALLPVLARLKGAPPDSYLYLGKSIQSFPRLSALSSAMERAGLEVLHAQPLFLPGLILLVGKKR